MTAHELAKLLLDGPNLEVAFSHDSGDYWNTTVAESCNGVEQQQLVYSDYHVKYIVPDSQSELDRADADVITAVVIY